MELAHESPQLVLQSNSPKLDDLIQIGEAFRQSVQNANRLKDGNTTQIIPLINQQIQQQKQELDRIAAQLGAGARWHQQNIYGNTSSAFGVVSPAQSAGASLSGAKLLSQAYVNFGLTNSLQADDTLHLLLNGNQTIPDASTLQGDFAAYSSSSIPNTADNQIAEEIATINSRLSALSTSITGALDQVQQSQTPESLSQVDVSLEDLQSFEALKRASALSTCNFVLSPALASFGSAGGIGTISIQELTGCKWTASTSATWLTSLLSASGSGNGNVTYFVSPTQLPRRVMRVSSLATRFSK